MCAYVLSCACAGRARVLAVRVQRAHKYDAAAADCAHLLRMQKVVYGPQAAELISTAERLCKAHVLLRRWAPAREALQEAHAISTAKNGAGHRETLRIGDVLQSLTRYAPQRPANVAARRG